MTKEQIIYTCGRCGVYKTKRKSDIHRHLNRKRKCQPKDEKKIHKKYTKDTQKIHKVFSHEQKDEETKQHIEEKKKKEWKCKHCGKIFASNCSMNRHIRLYCKKKKDEMELLRQRVRELEIQTILNNINNNRTPTNTTNINNIQINNTININAHGNEDISHLQNTIMIMLSHFTQDAITDLISCTYFDPKHPENKTVRILNKKEKWAQIYNGNEWEFRHKKDIILKVLKDSYYKLAVYFMNNKPDIPKDSCLVWSSIENPWLDKKLLATTEQILLNQKETANLNEIKKIMKRKGYCINDE